MTDNNITAATTDTQSGGVTPNNPPASAGASNDSEEGGKRKGFHPTLVAATVVTVIFVLWFCPWALMRARIAANEAAAESVMRGGKFLLLDIPAARLRERIALSRNREDMHDLRLVMASYSGLRLDDPSTGRGLFLLRPLYYGRTARLSYCNYAGQMYCKDLGAEPDIAAPVVPDDTWTAFK